MKMKRDEWVKILVRAQILVQRGQRIEAIKLLREKTGCGIKEAYDATRRLE